MGTTKKARGSRKSNQASLLVAGLRKLYQYYWPAKKRILFNKREKRAMNGRMVYFHECAICKEWFPTDLICVDHIIPVGMQPDLNSEDFGEYCKRLFCDEPNLQKLCKKCHLEKTREDNKLTKEIRRFWTPPEIATDTDNEMGGK